MTTNTLSPLPSSSLFPSASYAPFVYALDAPGGAVDVIGDIHGCMDELVALLTRAGYKIGEFNPRGSEPIAIHHPEGRKLVFIGDLIDRGPYSDQVLRLAMGLQRSGTGCTVMGNHDWKLARVLMGRQVKIKDALLTTLEQLTPLGSAFLGNVLDLYIKCPHQVRVSLDWDHPYEGATSLWLTHAAAKTHRQGETSSSAFSRSIYGYANNETDENGFLIREDWAEQYRGANPVIHGHVVHREPYLKNRVICIDTGCVFGNKLTLYRVDSGEFLFEAAARNYSGENRFLD